MTDVVVAALAAIWAWRVLNTPKAPPPIPWIARALRRLPKGDYLVTCPWCIGAWFSIIGVIALGQYNPVYWLAAAGLCGYAATFLLDDGGPT